MVVDDELPIREWLKSVLKRLNYGIEVIACVSSGEEGIRQCEKETPDLVITDIKMGNLDGIEMLKKIRRISSDVYFVMLTSYSDFNYVRDSLRYGADEYILKTEITEDSLKKIVENYLKKKHSGKPEEEKIHISELLIGDLKKLTETYGIISEPDTKYYAIAIDCTDGEEIKRSVFSDQIEISGIYYPGSTMQLYLFRSAKNHSDIYSYNEIMESAANISLSYERNVGFSGTCDTKAMAIQRAYRALNYSFYADQRNAHLFTWKNSIGDNATETKLSLIRDEGIQEIYRDNFSEAISRLREFCKLAKSAIYPDIYWIKQTIIDMINAYKLSQISFGNKDFQERIEDIKQQVRDSRSIDRICEIVTGMFDSNVNDLSANAAFSAYTKQAIRYVGFHYRENISLQDIADFLKINQDYFCRIFKNDTGQTFVSYLTDYKIRKAQALLLETDVTLNDVSEMLGFSSLSYFSRVFKKETGSNPFDYRMMKKKDKKQS